MPVTALVTVVLVGDDAMAMKDALPGTLRIQTRTMRELDGMLATHIRSWSDERARNFEPSDRWGGPDAPLASCV